MSETVFVYGSLKRGFRNFHVMDGATFMDTGVTHPAFTMIDLGPYPAVVRGIHAISGEVYAVPRALMGRLDELEDNGTVYQREVVPIMTPRGSVNAWIYVYLLDPARHAPVAPRDGPATWRETPTSPAEPEQPRVP